MPWSIRATNIMAMAVVPECPSQSGMNEEVAALLQPPVMPPLRLPLTEPFRSGDLLFAHRR